MSSGDIGCNVEVESGDLSLHPFLDDTCCIKDVCGYLHTFDLPTFIFQPACGNSSLLWELEDKEIARRVGLTPTAVSTRIYRGRKLLQEALRKEGYVDV